MIFRSTRAGLVLLKEKLDSRDMVGSTVAEANVGEEVLPVQFEE